ncbi:peptidase T [Phyllobacterium myrsinacearum]|uniref:Peptidase T n=1 Tax=Phyllobacterium myrsinacearum TaxID=28101 RepID=A0A839EQX4_9HYPH|nr:peptidase T [Phyllobacterium myrsinacearum]MBA8878857.1 tripeptide aminopeptidase [Phyllobacterium myrsinacearum]
MDIVERFLSYTRINTTTVPGAGHLPSSPGQSVLARLLAGELRELGLNVEERDHSIVVGTLLSNVQDKSRKIPTVAWVAHLDTSNEYSTDTHARIVSYNGGDIVLNEELNVVLRSSEFPELARYAGDRIIVTDGTSLLGADNKSAIAEIMHAIQTLQTNPQIEHGDVKVVFVPDEEIGLLGAKALDVTTLNADFAYTLDCCEIGEIVFENWNAGEFHITFRGQTAHPMSAKGKLRNAVLFAQQFIAMLPAGERPEYTENREGYYWVKSVHGTVAEARIVLDIRDFTQGGFEHRRQFVETLVESFNRLQGTQTVVSTYQPMYRNVAEGLQGSNRYAVDLALEAMKAIGVEPKSIPMRGGYDGAVLSEKGLPCPNLFCGAHNFHSIYEFLPVNSLNKASEMVVEILRRTAKPALD